MESANSTDNSKDSMSCAYSNASLVSILSDGSRKSGKKKRLGKFFSRSIRAEAYAKSPSVRWADEDGKGQANEFYYITG
jgi:hypothetical protein